MKSTNIVEVVPVHLEKHPNADALSIVRIGGYTVCVQTTAWQGVTHAAYIPPDSLVDVNREEFSWLKDDKHPTEYRVRAKKLRGIVSFGMLVKAPDGSKVGDDVTKILGVKHYEPELSISTGGDWDKAPNVYTSKYDVDTLRKYRSLFIEGEPVLITEKIHGANARYVFVDDRMCVGTRTGWVKESDKSPWWKALKNHPEIETFCTSNPGYILYGEVYGQVQNMKYDAAGTCKFAGFDIMKDGIWVEPEERLKSFDFFGINKAPVIETNFPYDFDKICEIAEGPSRLGGSFMEGVVVEPFKTRYHESIGRVKLKLVSANYLLKG